MKHQNKFAISEIQQLNVVWVFGSLMLLYYGVTGDSNDLIGSFVWILMLFCVVLYLGNNVRRKEIKDNMVVGEITKGQWGR